MKAIKKLTLNKEVISILGGNEMNLVKGGTYQPTVNCGILTANTICTPCPTEGTCNGSCTCPATGVENSCQASNCYPCGPTLQTCNNTCPPSCNGTCNTCTCTCACK